MSYVELKCPKKGCGHRWHYKARVEGRTRITCPSCFRNSNLKDLLYKEPVEQQEEPENITIAKAWKKYDNASESDWKKRDRGENDHR